MNAQNSVWQSMTTLFLLRCHRMTAQVRQLAARLTEATGVPPTLVCDESRGSVETAPYPKISLTPEHISRWDLASVPQDWGWSCGDFCYYRALEECPGYDRYLLIETDVHLFPKGAARLVEVLGNTDADVIAPYFRRSDPALRLYRGLRRIGLDPHLTCFFPLTAMAAHVIPKVMQVRRDVQANPGKRNVADEAVLSGAVGKYALSHAGLATVAPDLVSEETFCNNPPFLYEAVQTWEDQSTIVHPSVPLDAVLERIAEGSRKYAGRRIQRVLNMASPDQERLILAALDVAKRRNQPDFESPPLRIVENCVKGVPIRFAVADPQDEIQRYHARGQFYEAEELEIIARHFPAGGRYCDIGSNIGNHIVYVGLNLDPSAIVAIEPNPPAIALLRTNVMLNRLEHVVDLTRLGIGFSDRPSEDATLQANRHNLGSARLTDTAGGGIALRSGDDVFAEEQFDFIKIDVEGSEIQILNGLKATIERNRPPIFVEVDNQNDDAFHEWMDDTHYSVVETFQRYRTNKNYLVRPRAA